MALLMYSWSLFLLASSGALATAGALVDSWGTVAAWGLAPLATSAAIFRIGSAALSPWVRVFNRNWGWFFSRKDQMRV